mmetsp:Transcript_17658/g.30844  ORF Transcript_17658/g.30844 Transcript_17658/m.30844 type:complete len:220 (-) Transcript_17658:614-1273(-)
MFNSPPIGPEKRQILLLPCWQCRILCWEVDMRTVHGLVLPVLRGIPCMRCCLRSSKPRRQQQRPLRNLCSGTTQRLKGSNPSSMNMSSSREPRWVFWPERFTKIPSSEAIKLDILWLQMEPQRTWHGWYQTAWIMNRVTRMLRMDSMKQYWPEKSSSSSPFLFEPLRSVDSMLPMNLWTGKRCLTTFVRHFPCRWTMQPPRESCFTVACFPLPSKCMQM